MTRWLPPLLGLVACRPGEGSPIDTPRADPSDTAGPGLLAGIEGLRRALEREGFAIAEGGIEWDAVADCCEWGTCLHVNPNGEYGTWALPPGPGEFVGDRLVRDDGTILAPRLRADEAVLFVGPPPPGARYTSFRTYVHDVQRGGFREIEFQNLGDSLNEQVWEVNADGTLLVVTTPDRQALDAVGRSAAAAGWPAVNLDGIPADQTVLGYDQGANGFHTTLRVVGFDDRARFDAWQEAAGARVWRLTPVTERAPVPLPSAPARPATALDDPGLAASVTALEQAIRARYQGWVALPATLFEMEPPPGEPTCWNGCNRDVSYVLSNPTYLADGERVVGYGVDPAALGRAAWTELVIVGTENNDSGGGAGTISWRGSARPWVPEDPRVDDLYAWTFARRCDGDPYCTEVPTDCPGVELDEPGLFAWRHYLDPLTGTFPPLAGLGQRGAIKFVPAP